MKKNLSERDSEEDDLEELSINFKALFQKIFKIKQQPEINLVEELEKPFSAFNQDKIHPWSQVMSCYFNKLNPQEYRDKIPCHSCSTPSHYLVWIKFSSPYKPDSEGTEGVLSVCEKCKRQVEYREERQVVFVKR